MMNIVTDPANPTELNRSVLKELRVMQGFNSA